MIGTKKAEMEAAGSLAATLPKEQAKKKRSALGVAKQIDRLLGEVTDRERAGVLAWLFVTYGPDPATVNALASRPPELPYGQRA